MDSCTTGRLKDYCLTVYTVYNRGEICAKDNKLTLCVGEDLNPGFTAVTRYENKRLTLNTHFTKHGTLVQCLRHWTEKTIDEPKEQYYMKY